MNDFRFATGELIVMSDIFGNRRFEQCHPRQPGE